MENSGEHQMLLVDAVSLCGPLLLPFDALLLGLKRIPLGQNWIKMGEIKKVQFKRGQNAENVPSNGGKMKMTHLRGVKI